MDLRNSLKRGAIIGLFAVTPITLTGCTYEFGLKGDDHTWDELIPKELKELGRKGAEDIGAFKQALSDLNAYIDESDIIDDSGEIKEKAEQIAEDNDLIFVRATLVRVVDGDTIVVEINGEQEKVRLIGIDTPESVASQEYLDRTGKENTEAGKTASEHTKDILKDVKELWLEKDVSDTDRYGRALRYVWLEKPEDKENIVEISTKMLNAVLIKDGYAEIATYPPDTHYKDDLQYVYDMSHDDGYDDNERE